MRKFGEIRGGVACWRTKAAISLKCVKIEEKLLWRAYRKSPTLFRTVPSPTLRGSGMVPDVADRSRRYPTVADGQVGPVLTGPLFGQTEIFFLLPKYISPTESV